MRAKRKVCLTGFSSGESSGKADAAQEERKGDSSWNRRLVQPNAGVGPILTQGATRMETINAGLIRGCNKAITQSGRARAGQNLVLPRLFLLALLLPIC